MIDLSRPPVRPGPRSAGWVFYAVLWGVSFAVLILVYSLMLQPSANPPGAPAPGVDVLLLVLAAVGLVAALLMGYAALRLRKGGSAFSNVLQARGYPVGDPESGRARASDPEERAAWRQFKRKEITRVDYERRMAYRRFVHGELSLKDYHEIVRELADEAESPPPRAGPPKGRD